MLIETQLVDNQEVGKWRVLQFVLKIPKMSGTNLQID
jgi:hypothetical protein